MSTQKFATNALHAGHDVSKHAGTRAVPIYLDLLKQVSFTRD